jgi:hypothetical protein
VTNTRSSCSNAKFGSLEEYVLNERQMTFPQSQGLIYHNVLVPKIQILELLIKVLNGWINSEKSGRSMKFILCVVTLIRKMHKSDYYL